MSLEQAISDNTAALKELIGALQGINIPITAETESGEKPAKKKKTDKKKEKEKDESKYAELEIAILSMVEKNAKAEAAAILEMFGVTKLPGLSPEEYDEALALFKEALEKLESDKGEEQDNDSLV